MTLAAAKPASNNGPVADATDPVAPQPQESSRKAPSTESAPSAPAPTPKRYDLSQPADLTELLKEDDKTISVEVGKHVASILTKHSLTKYTTLMLYDNCDAISTYHANQIYEAAQQASDDGIFLIVQTAGGSVEPAYLISKTCRQLTSGKFIVAVPRKAKSAGTMLALGAAEIHMGLMSELGPIDPQIEGVPALGLISSLNVLAETVCKHKDSAELFARYLSRNLKVEDLGYYARIPESAVQYAERLLKKNESKLPKGMSAQAVAQRLVHHYKDHRFVIDIDEAAQFLGELIKSETPEYRAANEIYSFLVMLEWRLSLRSKDMWYAGSIATGCILRKAKA